MVYARQGLALSDVNKLMFFVPLLGFKLTPLKQHGTALRFVRNCEKLSELGFPFSGTNILIPL